MKLNKYLNEGKIGIKAIVIIGFLSGEIVGVAKNINDAKKLAQDIYNDGVIEDTTFTFSEFDGKYLIKSKGFDATIGKLF